MPHQNKENAQLKTFRKMLTAFTREHEMWDGVRIDSDAKKPFEVIRHTSRTVVDPEVMARFARSEDADRAAQAMPTEAAMRKALAVLARLPDDEALAVIKAEARR